MDISQGEPRSQGQTAGGGGVTRCSVRWAAARLGMNAASVHSAARAGLLALTVEDVDRLVEAPLPRKDAIDKNTLVVVLAPSRPLREKGDGELEADGRWRAGPGWWPEMSADDLRDAASGWWTADKDPSAIVAVAKGTGQALGAWRVARRVEEQPMGGRKRWDLTEDEALRKRWDGTRVPPVRGPASYWWSEHRPHSEQAVTEASQKQGPASRPPP